MENAKRLMTVTHIIYVNIYWIVGREYNNLINKKINIKNLYFNNNEIEDTG